MSKLLILVAEDEKDIRELLVFTFQAYGFQAIGVSNGEEAVKKATRKKPDLILMDVRMPKMSGFKACQLLKAQESTKHIPVVFLSAKGELADIRTGLALGAEAYFVKPFVPHELAQQISEILAKHGKL